MFVAVAYALPIHESPRARRQLLRRAVLRDVLDLLALPPAVEEVEDAEADQLEGVAVAPLGVVVAAGCDLPQMNKISRSGIRIHLSIPFPPCRRRRPRRNTSPSCTGRRRRSCRKKRRRMDSPPRNPPPQIRAETQTTILRRTTSWPRRRRRLRPRGPPWGD